MICGPGDGKGTVCAPTRDLEQTVIAEKSVTEFKTKICSVKSKWAQSNFATGLAYIVKQFVTVINFLFFDAGTCLTLTSSTVACARVMSAETEHGTKAPSE